MHAVCPRAMAAMTKEAVGCVIHADVVPTWRPSDGGASSGSDTAGLRSLRRHRASIDSDGGKACIS